MIILSNSFGCLPTFNVIDNVKILKKVNITKVIFTAQIMVTAINSLNFRLKTSENVIKNLILNSKDPDYATKKLKEDYLKTKEIDFKFQNYKNPLLILYGDNELYMNIDVINEIKALNSNAEVLVIKNSGHDVWTINSNDESFTEKMRADHRNDVNEKIKSFIIND